MPHHERNHRKAMKMIARRKGCSMAELMSQYNVTLPYRYKVWVYRIFNEVKQEKQVDGQFLSWAPDDVMWVKLNRAMRSAIWC